MARSGKKFKDQTLARKQEQRPRVKPRYDRYDEEAA